VYYTQSYTLLSVSLADVVEKLFTSVSYNAENLLLVCCRRQYSPVAMATVSDAEWLRQRRANLTLNVGTRAADPAPDAVLSSPDVRLLKLASPELERLVLQQYSQHHQHYHHHQQQQESSADRGLTLDVVANEQYSRGFVDALFEAHAQRQADCNPAVCRSTTSTIPAVTASVVRAAPYQADFCHAVAVGRDDLAFSDTPPSSPVDTSLPVDDERTRLERKRARNRQAAMRCRNRKLERIDQLQSQADQLRAANARLVDEVKQLRGMVNKLRQEVLLHADCQLTVTLPLRTSAFDSNVR